MFSFFQTIFEKITYAVASIVIAIGLVSVPATPPETPVVEPVKQAIVQEGKTKKEIPAPNISPPAITKPLTTFKSIIQKPLLSVSSFIEPQEVVQLSSKPTTVPAPAKAVEESRVSPLSVEPRKVKPKTFKTPSETILDERGDVLNQAELDRKQIADELARRNRLLEEQNKILQQQTQTLQQIQQQTAPPSPEPSPTPPQVVYVPVPVPVAPPPPPPPPLAPVLSPRFIKEPYIIPATGFRSSSTTYEILGKFEIADADAVGFECRNGETVIYRTNRLINEWDLTVPNDGLNWGQTYKCVFNLQKITGSINNGTLTNLPVTSILEISIPYPPEIDPLVGLESNANYSFDKTVYFGDGSVGTPTSNNNSQTFGVFVIIHQGGGPLRIEEIKYESDIPLYGQYGDLRISCSNGVIIMGPNSGLDGHSHLEIRRTESCRVMLMSVKDSNGNLKLPLGKHYLTIKEIKVIGMFSGLFRYASGLPITFTFEVVE